MSKFAFWKSARPAGPVQTGVTAAKPGGVLLASSVTAVELFLADDREALLRYDVLYNNKEDPVAGDTRQYRDMFALQVSYSF